MSIIGGYHLGIKSHNSPGILTEDNINQLNHVIIIAIIRSLVCIFYAH